MHTPPVSPPQTQSFLGRRAQTEARGKLGHAAAPRGGAPVPSGADRPPLPSAPSQEGAALLAPALPRAAARRQPQPARGPASWASTGTLGQLQSQCLPTALELQGSRGVGGECGQESKRRALSREGRTRTVPREHGRSSSTTGPGP